MARIDKYLQYATTSGASDIHISSGEPVRIRVDGDLQSVDEKRFSAADAQDMIFEILSEAEQESFIQNKNLDKSIEFSGIGMFRLNVFLTRRGISAVLRAIPTKVPSIRELGLPENIERLIEQPKGLILVTGPTGSGKSTTLAAMINHINSRFPYHILTVEDPVEFVHENKRALINQREIGASVKSFADALKYALREDPDVILVGELRDLETISLALTAAETGHLVFATLHTRGAASSIDRIIDSFPANQQAMIRTMVSESLVAVISQALLKKAMGRGRVAAYEIMVVNHAISNLIREGKTFQIPSVMQTARKEGMVLLSQYVRELMVSGAVTEEEGSIYFEDGGQKGKGIPNKGAATFKPQALGDNKKEKTGIFNSTTGAPAASSMGGGIGRPGSTPPKPPPMKSGGPQSAPSTGNFAPLSASGGTNPAIPNRVAPPPPPPPPAKMPPPKPSAPQAASTPAPSAAPTEAASSGEAVSEVDITAEQDGTGIFVPSNDDGSSGGDDGGGFQKAG